MFTFWHSSEAIDICIRICYNLHMAKEKITYEVRGYTRKGFAEYRADIVHDGLSKQKSVSMIGEMLMQYAIVKWQSSDREEIKIFQTGGI